MSACGWHCQVYRCRSPIYTMRPQIYVRPFFCTPAPNAYRPENVVLHKPTIFRKTFGVKHTVFAGAMLSKVTSQCRMVGAEINVLRSSTGPQCSRFCNSCPVRAPGLRFLTGCRTRRLNQALAVLSLSL